MGRVMIESPVAARLHSFVPAAIADVGTVIPQTDQAIRSAPHIAGIAPTFFIQISIPHENTPPDNPSLKIFPLLSVRKLVVRDGHDPKGWVELRIDDGAKDGRQFDLRRAAGEPAGDGREERDAFPRLRLTRVLSSRDMTHNFVATCHYDLPFVHFFRRNRVTEGELITAIHPAGRMPPSSKETPISSVDAFPAAHREGRRRGACPAASCRDRDWSSIPPWPGR